ncbi:hypothetical protein VNG_0280H [Halobacterium salinarum NRC-1]|uniref:Spurious ORF n=1 Tax=Halobacterium salinarum (strain ATCC 700922 / JCM 11081 / NRC-1) TaxID=64091 RepID=Q9HSE0_HALSA|nr:hypothetical protein VNG_0280H [Halobacterium salinarum NRC-1]DAC77556.1 TPA_inf: spurious ORF [Halobacterium salinarum NRC-1]
MLAGGHPTRITVGEAATRPAVSLSPWTAEVEACRGCIHEHASPDAPRTPGGSDQRPPRRGVGDDDRRCRSVRGHPPHRAHLHRAPWRPHVRGHARVNASSPRAGYATTWSAPAARSPATRSRTVSESPTSAKSRTAADNTSRARPVAVASVAASSGSARRTGPRRAVYAPTASRMASSSSVSTVGAYTAMSPSKPAARRPSRSRWVPRERSSNCVPPVARAARSTPSVPTQGSPSRASTAAPRRGATARSAASSERYAPWPATRTRPSSGGMSAANESSPSGSKPSTRTGVVTRMARPSSTHAASASRSGMWAWPS